MLPSSEDDDEDDDMKLLSSLKILLVLFPRDPGAIAQLMVRISTFCTVATWFLEG